jgi:hypothetical protein
MDGCTARRIYNEMSSELLFALAIMTAIHPLPGWLRIFNGAAAGL